MTSARRNQREALEQAKVIAWAQKQLKRWPCLRFLFHTPNGGMRNPVIAGQFKAMGVRRGVPDLQLHHRVSDGIPPWPRSYQGIVIEMKERGGKLTPEQRDWFAHLTAQEWIYLTCFSAEEAIKSLEAYLTGAFGLIERHAYRDIAEAA